MYVSARAMTAPPTTNFALMTVPSSSRDRRSRTRRGGPGLVAGRPAPALERHQLTLQAEEPPPVAAEDERREPVGGEDERPVGGHQAKTSSSCRSRRTRLAVKWP